jgi:hypothetical protein
VPKSGGLARRRRTDAAWAGVADADVPVATPWECRCRFRRRPNGVKLGSPASRDQRGPPQRPLGRASRTVEPAGEAWRAVALKMNRGARAFDLRLKSLSAWRTLIAVGVKFIRRGRNSIAHGCGGPKLPGLARKAPSFRAGRMSNRHIAPIPPRDLARHHQPVTGPLDHRLTAACGVRQVAPRQAVRAGIQNR